jgi:type IX secretion system PorP/SprF family membrane protein
MSRTRRAWPVLVWGLAITATAQDAQFSQFYATPTQLNPAFAGTGLQSRFGLVFRDQWPGFPGAFVSGTAAFDHYFSEANSGIGMLVHHDRAGSGALRYTSAAFQYAYEIELKRKVFLRPALQLGMVEHAVDFSKLVFGDQLARGSSIGTYEHLNGQSVRYADMGAGLLYFTPRLWLGASVHHLNQPNQSLLGNEARVPRRYNVHGGYRSSIRTPIIQKHAQSIVYAFNYRAQEKYDQLDVGAYYERAPIYAGLWYRGIPLLKRYDRGYANNDAVAVLVGFIVDDLRIGYSYDITISRLAGQAGGAHELTLGYEIAQPHKKKSMAKRRVVPCAKF